MAGLHLTQLLAACQGLDSAIHSAIQAAGLDPLTAVGGDPPAAGAAYPYLVVTLGGWRRRDPGAVGPTTLDTVWVLFRLETAAGELDALAYEGLVAHVAATSRDAVAAEITAAAVACWRLDRSPCTPQPARAGGLGWTSTVKLRVGLEW